MAKQTGNDTVVGVFLDDGQAQRAIEMLKSSGYKARVADESALKAFRSAGWEDEVISLYESRMSEGNSIVTVEAGDRGTDALGMMLEQGAEYINLSDKGGSGQMTQQVSEYKTRTRDKREYGQMDQKTGRRRNADEMMVQLRDETLTATKQSVQAGEVGLRKVVTERQEEVPVTLRREEVFIERHAVDRPLRPGEELDMTDETIQVPVYEEQAQLQKQTRVREEVSLGKQSVEEQQTLVGTVRSEDVEIMQTGDVEIRGEDQTTTRTTRTETETSKSK